MSANNNGFASPRACDIQHSRRAKVAPLLAAGMSALRDDNAGGRGRRPSRNVLGEPLDICSFKPMTGFYRDGCCNTGQEDIGSHTVCTVMTSGFFDFSKSRGNDLSTPVPEFGFPDLKPAAQAPAEL